MVGYLGYSVTSEDHHCGCRMHARPVLRDVYRRETDALRGFLFRVLAFGEPQKWTTAEVDINRVQSDVNYGFVYVDEDGFDSYRPASFRELLGGFTECQAEA